jgi:hypothetical protein
MICCRTCAKEGKLTKAEYAAPQYEGGDENGHVNWIAICKSCLNNWYEDVVDNLKIPFFTIQDAHHNAHPDHSLVEEEVAEAESINAVEE